MADVVCLLTTLICKIQKTAWGLCSTGMLEDVYIALGCNDD